jgi:hypothetical protein
MPYLSLVLLLFVGLGLARDRLGRFTYIFMGVIVVAYVAFTYHRPQ